MELYSEVAILHLVRFAMTPKDSERLGTSCRNRLVYNLQELIRRAPQIVTESCLAVAFR
jgi:hypothetical protein